MSGLLGGGGGGGPMFMSVDFDFGTSACHSRHGGAEVIFVRTVTCLLDVLKDIVDLW